jgi:hypothetical protein
MVKWEGGRWCLFGRFSCIELRNPRERRENPSISLTMFVISILIINFINKIAITTKLYEKHTIHERYTYEYTCQTYISTKCEIDMPYIHLKSNIKQSIYMPISTTTS